MYFFQVLEFDSVSGLIANLVPQEGAVLQCDFMPSAWCGIDRVISPPNFQTQYSGRVVPSQHCECCIRDFIFAPLLFKESGACISWLSSAHSFFFFLEDFVLINAFCYFSQTPNGNVEAKVMCFYRRREISGSLIMLADKHQSKQSSVKVQVKVVVVRLAQYYCGEKPSSYRRI